MEHTEHRQSTFMTWLIIFLLLLIIAFKGGLAYFMIGDRGQPDWDYRPVKDVPGESPYALYEYLPFPQHVEGHESDYPPLGDYPPIGKNWDESFFPPPQQNAIGR
jgi:hypothetical protein